MLERTDQNITKKNTLSPGTILDGRYEIRRVIGKGGFGVTYEAVNRIGGQRVAIKERMDGDMAYFLREARALRDFAGEGAVVTVLDYLEEDGAAFLVMEYLDGVTLREYIEKDGPVTMERAVRLFVPVMEALQHMHAAGVIHRDVSPDNLMVMPDGALKLMDFGAAKSYGENPVTHSVIYKPSYSPPEQLDRTGVMGAYTDVYALCGTIYYCITAKAPEDVVSRLLMDELMPPSRLGAEVLPAAEKILLEGLSLDSDERIPTVGTLQESLLKLYPDLSEEEKKEAARRQRRRLSIAAGLTAALFAAALLFCYMNRVRLRFLMEDTVSARFYGNEMTKEEFEVCLDGLKDRTNALTDGWYLMEKDADEQVVRITFPRCVFGETDPQTYLRKTLIRPMELSILLEGSDERQELGVFDKEKELEEAAIVSPDDPGWKMVAEALGDTGGGEPDPSAAADAAPIEFDAESSFYILTFSEEAALRFKGALDEKRRPVKIIFDEEMAQKFLALPRVSYSFYTLGDGRSVATPDPVNTQDDNVISVPDALLLLHLRQKTLPSGFSVSADFSVRWEDPSGAMLPGEKQVREEDVPGRAMLFQLDLGSSNTESVTFNSRLVSMQAVLKSRLDRMGIPYASGFDLYDSNSLILKLPVDRFWYIELSRLTDSLNDYLRFGSPYAKDPELSANLGCVLIEDAPDGTFRLSLKPDSSRNTDDWKAVARKCMEADLPLVLYLDEIPVASCDAGEALSALAEEGTIKFTQWEIAGHREMTEDTRHFADFLSSAIVQSAPNYSSFQNAVVLDPGTGHRMTLKELRSMKLMEDHLPADQQELALRWNKRYSQSDHEIGCSTEFPYNYSIRCYGVDVHHTEVFDDFMAEIREKDRSYFEEGKVRGLTITFYSKEGPEQSGGSYVCVTLSQDLITGDLLVTEISCGGEEYEKLEELWESVVQKNE